MPEVKYNNKELSKVGKFLWRGRNYKCPICEDNTPFFYMAKKDNDWMCLCRNCRSIVKKKYLKLATKQGA